jgi:hypothetical protein
MILLWVIIFGLIVPAYFVRKSGRENGWGLTALVFGLAVLITLALSIWIGLAAGR